MYKILFCDIDGTLTKTASKISRLNLIAIKKYLLNGGEFVLCSGRSYNACKSIIKKIEVFTGYKLHFLICLAGAMVVDLEKNEFVFTKKIPNMVAKTLYGYARKNRFWYWGYKLNNDKHTVYSNTKWFSFFTNHLKGLKTIKIKKDETFDFAKIILMSASKHKIIRFFKKHSDLKLNVVFQNHYFCEITNEGIDKGFCINMILRLLNISATDAIAIGNGMNDIAAFKAVNTSIAVNCKNPRIFQTATYHYKRFKNIIYKVMKEHIINIG